MRARDKGESLQGLYHLGIILESRGGGYHWHQPPPPAVASIHCDITVPPVDVGPFMAGLQQGLAQPAVLETFAVELRGTSPRSISVPIGRPALRTRSFFFDAPPETALLKQESPAASPASNYLGRLARPEGATRIKPPGDVIKLEDRLQYILQPSLESLLMEQRLAFPCCPFPFQFDGIAFLFPRHAAILADEMGLGKTMQAITAIRLLLRRQEIRSALLVCPKPLVTNWQREFALWAPEVPMTVVEGDQARRCWQWQLPDVPVRIANYELLCRDRELLEGTLASDTGVAGNDRGVQFDLVVLDESQRIKNQASTTSQVVRAIARKRSWALTGTPIENSAEDLVGIFEFLVPGYLSAEMKPSRMARAVGDYVLRRTKDQVLRDLPPKLFRDAELELSTEQRESYRLAEDEGVLRLTGLGKSATIRHVFELLLRLKQICNFDPVTGASAKFERLEADLEEIADSGRKAILFSQWVGTLETLARRLRRFGPLEYHGKIPARQREAMIRNFREDAGSHVLLMSYGAGGVGLNLQFAHYVFLFDRWWNPAVEDQAINRAHRIGVSGPVTVTRFLMLETIEERIDRILQEKRDLFDTIFSGTGSHNRMGLSPDELFGLFQLKYPGGALDAAA
jgi:SNF2 family DNA or RNA helicase